jgi:hypothetical protein
MVKLKKILNEIRKPERGFKTQRIKKDPETGSISWDVEYNFSLEDIYKDLDKVVLGMSKAIRQNPNDRRLIDLFQDAKNLRNRIKRIITNPA